jgi:putative FmdB family regulatory protein
MPTYEYACAACEHEFEAFQSIKDAPLTACPKCGEDKARRQISRGTGFILKGGGWYSDLYSSPSGNKKPSSDGGSSGSSGSSGDGGSSSTSTSSTPSGGGSSDGGGTKTAAA